MILIMRGTVVPQWHSTSAPPRNARVRASRAVQEQAQLDVVHNGQTQGFVATARAVGGCAHQVERANAQVCARTVAVHARDPVRQASEERQMPRLGAERFGGDAGRQRDVIGGISSGDAQRTRNHVWLQPAVGIGEQQPVARGEHWRPHGMRGTCPASPPAGARRVSRARAYPRPRAAAGCRRSRRWIDRRRRSPRVRHAAARADDEPSLRGVRPHRAPPRSPSSAPRWPASRLLVREAPRAQAAAAPIAGDGAWPAVKPTKMAAVLMNAMVVHIS